MLGRKKLPSGTTATAVDAKGLCAIINACSKSGVKRLKFGDVEVTFVEEPVITPEISSDNSFQPLSLDPLGFKPVSLELATQQQQLLDEAELVDMQISDPVSWENHCVDMLVHGDRSLDG